MLKYTRKDKRLRIPVGLGTNNNIDASLLFNVSDGDAKPEDLLAGKTAYSSEGYITGTLDVETEKTNSYKEGYTQGEQDGYVSGEADGFADGYAEGKEDGIEEILTEQSDADITPSSVLEGKIGYGKNNERIVGTNVGGFDFGEIGYNEVNSNECNSNIKNAMLYSKQKLVEWNNSPSNSVFQNDIQLKYAPFIDTSRTTNFSYLFYGCSNLTYIPDGLDFSNADGNGFSNMFYKCSTIENIPYLKCDNLRNLMNTFYYCNNLKTVSLPDTSKVTSAYWMFYNCYNLSGNYELDLSSCTTVNEMFYCSTSNPFYGNTFNVRLYNITSKLTSYNSIFYGCAAKKITMDGDLSHITSAQNWFRWCKKLEEIDVPLSLNPTTWYYSFNTCWELTTLPLLNLEKCNNVGDMLTNCYKLTNVAGFKDLGKGFTGSSSYHTLSLTQSTTLTRQSCLNIFNSLYDMNLTAVTDAKITLASSVRSLLSAEDIAIATNKGWTIQ